MRWRWYLEQSPKDRKGIERIESQRKNWDCSDHSIVEIVHNRQKIPEDLKTHGVTVKNHQL